MDHKSLSTKEISDLTLNLNKGWRDKAKKSLQNGRHHKEVTIVLVGLSGAGKSSTINSLIPKASIKTSSVRSATRTIDEYSVEIPIGGLETKLTIVDTPGLQDAEGETISIIATLNAYLANKRAGENNRAWKPNLVLITANITDHRIDGDHSAFTIMLKCLFTICEDFFDHQNHNVLLVLTHFMNHLVEDVQEYPDDVVYSYINVLNKQTQLHFTKKHVVLAENYPKKYNLPQQNGIFALPCGEFYPHNLYEKAQSLMKNDPVGEIILNHAVTAVRDFKVTKKYPSTSILENQHPKVLKVRKIYEQSISGKPFLTALDRLLARHWSQIPEETRNLYPDTLFQMQSAFKLLNYNTENDIPKAVSGRIHMLKQLGSNQGVIKLLNSLGVNDLPRMNCEIITGKSYNLFNDKPLTSTIFELQKELRLSPIGLLIPGEMTLFSENSTHDITHVFSCAVECVSRRISDLGLTLVAPINPKVPMKFAGTARVGYNVAFAKENNNTDHFYSFSMMREQRLFKIEIQSNVTLKDEFIQAVRNLGSFNALDERSIYKYKSFFEKHGTHIIKSAFGGGSIEIQTKYKVSKSSKLETLQASADLMATLPIFEAGLCGSLNEANKTSSSNTVSMTSYRLRGGNLDSHKEKQLNGETKKYWIQSLTDNPIMLEGEMSLEAIQVYVGKVQPELEFDVEKAFTYIHELEIRKVVQFPPPIERRWCMVL